MGMLERTRTRMWTRWASVLVGLCVGAACCAGLMAGCSSSGPFVADEDQVADWAPDPSNYDFHVQLDTSWERGDSLAYASGEPIAVPNDESGIMFAGIEDGIARFRANLTCEGGDQWELYFAWGDVPGVGFSDPGVPFDGASSAEQTTFGQPYFPASTMTVFRRLVLAEGFEDELRAQVAGEATGAPLFTMQRLAYDDIPDVAWPNCWNALMQELVHEQAEARYAEPSA